MGHSDDEKGKGSGLEHHGKTQHREREVAVGKKASGSLDPKEQLELDFAREIDRTLKWDASIDSADKLLAAMRDRLKSKGGEKYHTIFKKFEEELSKPEVNQEMTTSLKKYRHTQQQEVRQQWKNSEHEQSAQRIQTNRQRLQNEERAMNPKISVLDKLLLPEGWLKNFVENCIERSERAQSQDIARGDRTAANAEQARANQLRKALQGLDSHSLQGIEHDMGQGGKPPRSKEMETKRNQEAGEFISRKPK